MMFFAQEKKQKQMTTDMKTFYMKGWMNQQVGQLDAGF